MGVSTWNFGLLATPNRPGNIHPGTSMENLLKAGGAGGGE
jgi:hypothetical protein